jgi:prefoldin alpha subunit
MGERDRLQSLVVELQYLEGLAQTLQQRISLVDAAIAELQIASSTLEGLKGEAAGAEILIPIGGGSYIKGKVGDSERLIVGVGADVAVERGVAEAIEMYSARVAELQRARSSLEQELEKVMAEAAKGRQELQRIVKQQQDKGKEDV